MIGGCIPLDGQGRGHTNNSALDFLRFQPVTNIERRTLRAWKLFYKSNVR